MLNTESAIIDEISAGLKSVKYSISKNIYISTGSREKNKQKHKLSQLLQKNIIKG